MAYRLKKDEPVARGLERIVKEELRSATTHLNSDEHSDKAIHEARKSIKKVRAILALIGDEIGADHDVKRLKRAGRLLSPLRDADAMIASTKKFCDHRRRALTGETCSAIRDLLNRHKERVRRLAARHRSEQRAGKLLKTVSRPNFGDRKNPGAGSRSTRVRSRKVEGSRVRSTDSAHDPCQRVDVLNLHRRRASANVPTV